jgi:Cdc6-like AAA superfamily ATPase
LKYHKAELEKIKVRVFAGANSIARLPPELLSRFVILRFSPYTQEEFCRIVLNILTKREGLSPSQAMYIADRLKNRTPDVRDAVKLARLSGGDRPTIDNLISTLYDKVCGDDKRG